MIPVSRETSSLLLKYEKQFREWNAVSNLAAPSTLQDFQNRHVGDCLQLLKFAKPDMNWVDLGSGGGLPGLVLGCALKGSKARITLVESREKKAAFLRKVVRDLDLPCDVLCHRIEHVNLPEPPDFITARALAPLPKLLSLSERWLTNNGVSAFFHKGRGYHQELGVAHGEWDFDLVVHSSTIAEDSVILEIENVRRR